MVDVFSKKKRSEIMRAVRSQGNKSTELGLIRQFRLNHITGWRRHYRISGHPDFVFPKKRVVVFADGCFWHGHACRNIKPANNREFWRNKIDRNKQRDRKVSQKLRSNNWKVLRIWECEISQNITRKFTILKRYLGIAAK